METKIKEELIQFKCIECGEKYNENFCATKNISICRWCSGEEN